MAITWLGWLGVGSAQNRIGFEAELVSQNLPGNSSTVRWRIVGQSKGGYQSYFEWRTSFGAVGSKAIALSANVVTALSSWVSRTVNHDSTGSGAFSGWLEYYDQFDETGRGRTSFSLALPRLYALPLAPTTIAVGATLGEISAESAVAQEVRGAPVTQYEVQRRTAGGEFAAMSLSGRRGSVPSAGLLDSLQVFRARARSAGGWGPWSSEVSFAVPALAGRRPDGVGGEVACQVAERYVGGGVWVPCAVAERFDGAGWVQPS